MRKYRNYIFFFIATFLGLMLLRYLAAIALVYRHNIAESGYLMSEIYACKDVLAKQATSETQPRIIVIAGSNGLYGINNRILEQETGLKTINMASHAGLPLDYLMYRAEKYIRKNDIVILPLEYAYYGREGYEDWAMHNLFYWGKSFLRDAPLWKQVTYLARIPTDVFLKHFTANKLPEDKKLVKYGICNFQEKEIIFSAFGPKNLRSDGTFYSGNTNVYKKNKRYSFEIKDSRLQQIAEYKKRIEDKGAKFFLTYPAMMKNKLFNLQDINIQDSLNTFHTNLARFNLFLICKPEDSYFERNYFYDTEYHLTNKGAMLRSANLGKCLQKYLKLKVPSSSSEKFETFVDLLSGFATPEETLVWTQDNQAKLAIYTDVRDKNILLSFHVIPFVVPQQPELNVNVNINDQNLANWKFKYGETKSQVELIIPSKYLKQNMPLILTFKISNHKSPKELGLSNDERHLGLGLVSISVNTN